MGQSWVGSSWVGLERWVVRSRGFSSSAGRWARSETCRWWCVARSRAGRGGGGVGAGGWGALPPAAARRAVHTTLVLPPIVILCAY